MSETMKTADGAIWDIEDSPHVPKIHRELEDKIVSHVRANTVYFTDGSLLRFGTVHHARGLYTGHITSEILRWK